MTSSVATRKDRDRMKALGVWGERKAFALLQKAGFRKVRDINAEMLNHPFADIYAERGNMRYIIGLKTRNKYQMNGIINPTYNVRKRGTNVGVIAQRHNATLAWVAIQAIPEEQKFSAYFGTIAQIEDFGERFSIPMKPEKTRMYECLADLEPDTSLRPEWSNGGYAHAIAKGR
jgi:hypothetical protein